MPLSFERSHAEACNVVRAASLSELPGRLRPDVSAVAVDAGNRRRGLVEVLQRTAAAFPAAKMLVVLDAESFHDDRVAAAFPPGRVQSVLVHPIDSAELTEALDRLLLLADFEGRAEQARGESGAEREPYMVGESRRMHETFDCIRRVARTDAPVLITGESGTGKELAARAIHEISDFCGGPFVAINCGGIPTDLIASELFGYEKGAFTGATQRKPGRVETAQDGTLFLDEIGDLPMPVQSHLLRFLQEGTLERVGGVSTLHVRTRIVAGTNVDLKEAVRQDRFREDLFYRLNVFQVEMPPLRERGEDVVILANYFLRRFAGDGDGERIEFSPSAVRMLKAHTWPGNVRELISAVRRGVVMCRHGRITARDLGLDGQDAHDEDTPSTLAEARERAERAAIAKALRRNRSRVGKAAETLGVSRITLYKLMKKYNMANPGEHSCSPDGGHEV
ncbi:sigma-54 interaction domain-containing protein [Ferruginivarius sediminum]|uniref:Sigma-54-dependent Fis family transcriptional regulator n=1 Tax=Ferruginivarius sediminum TaxID=2661937 RepID=A0A369TCG8_9PROT|nr:sigma-54 dependent transcriptional regulator [Ferruginivarius sediminum]RDD62978.1 sigma-54-dependent Fis family transcriptional regulator [Ferruginivarius sediminum]